MSRYDTNGRGIMIKFIKYFYIRIFNYFSDGSSVPLFRTFAIIFVMAYLNVLSLSTLIFSVWLNVKANLPAEGFWPLVIIVPTYAMFYHYLKRHGYHDLIVKEYSTETKRQKSIWGWLAIVYIISSMMLFVFALWIRQVVRGY